MARTKKHEKIDPVQRGTAHVRLDMTEEVRDHLRIMAARHGISMAALARTLLARLVEEDMRKHGG